MPHASSLAYLDFSPKYGYTPTVHPKAVIPTRIAHISTITPFHRIWDTTPQMYTEEANYSMQAVRDLYTNGHISRKSYEAAMLAIRDKAEGSAFNGMKVDEPAPVTTHPTFPVRTAATDPDAVFDAVWAMTGEGHIRGYIGRKAIYGAVQAHVRTSDIPTQVALKLDDIVQDITIAATERILRYRDNGDNYPVYAESVPDGADWDDPDDPDAPVTPDIYVHTDAGPVIGWYVRIGTPCGICEKCTKSRRCDDKSWRWEFYTVRRVVFALVQNVVTRHFRPDMNYLDLDVTGSDGMTGMDLMRYDVPIDLFGQRMTGESVNVPDVHPDPISPRVKRIARKVVASADAAGVVTVHPQNGRMSTDAGNLTAMVMGHTPSAEGRKRAYRKILAIQADYAAKRQND